jgi:hypothetical protein
VKRTTISIALALAALFLSSAALGLSDPQDSGQNREIGRTTEKEIKVTLSSAFGTVVIRKGEPSKVLLAESADDRSASGVMDMVYAIRNRVGFRMSREGKVEKDGNTGFKLISWQRKFLKFYKAIPISLMSTALAWTNLTRLDVRLTLSTIAAMSLALTMRTRVRSRTHRIRRQISSTHAILRMRTSGVSTSREDGIVHTGFRRNVAE